MEKLVLNVEGMSCSHCENAVKTAVGALAGVESVAVNLGDKTVTISHDPTLATLEAIIAAILDLGYDVV